MTKALDDRVNKLKVSFTPKGPMITNFGVFIDTHRDYPHIGTFGADIHRGMSRPIMVDLMPNLYTAPGSRGHQPHGLFDPESNTTIRLHDKHLFLEAEFFGKWLTGMMMDTGDPRDADGEIPTKLLRDPRAKPPIYLLRSFRQIVMARYRLENP